MIEVVRYQPSEKKKWDQFVENSKNGLFLFYRDYMDYHADRFIDTSLMFYKDGNLIGLMPANVENETLVSHGGLTFGGIVSNVKMTTEIMLEIFEKSKEFLKRDGFRKLIYKAIPYIYHLIPSEEDKYVLFINNARLFKTEVTSVINLQNRQEVQERRRRAVKKAKKENLIVTQSDDYESFMAIAASVLEKKYNLRPVHTAEELRKLANLFPAHIKLFIAEFSGTMLGGVIVYENKTIAHSQYSVSNDDGKNAGALDLVFDFLINDYYKEKQYFDFGVSTENGGRSLNRGLIQQKEGFGARAVVHESYELELL